MLSRSLFMSAASLLSLIVMVHSSSVIDSSFEFASYIQGEWKVSSSATDKMDDFAFDPNVTVMNITRDHESDELLLIGDSFMNDTETGEVSQESVIEIEFEDGDSNTGFFKSGKIQEGPKRIYDFNFQPQPGNVAISVGEWVGPHPGFYQFLVVDADRFTFTIFRGGNNEKITLYVGERVRYEIPKTFMQRYGSMGLILCVFFVNMYLQRTMKANMGEEKKSAAQKPEIAAKKSD